MRGSPSGNSSVGRARPCQGRGRGFESLFPLQFQTKPRSPEVLLFKGSIHLHARVESKTPSGRVAEWSCSGLQSRVRRFDSGPGLQKTTSPAIAGLVVCGLHLACNAATMRVRSNARMAKQVDARDLKSLGQKPSRFDSGSGHKLRFSQSCVIARKYCKTLMFSGFPSFRFISIARERRGPNDTICRADSASCRRSRLASDTFMQPNLLRDRYCDASLQRACDTGA